LDLVFVLVDKRPQRGQLARQRLNGQAVGGQEWRLVKGT